MEIEWTRRKVKINIGAIKKAQAELLDWFEKHLDVWYNDMSANEPTDFKDSQHDLGVIRVWNSAIKSFLLQKRKELGIE